MHMGRMPLYPPSGGCGKENCIRVPLFQNEPHRPHGDACAQMVRLENPCCPGEYADVALSVDCCGNLTVCVHRESCGCRRLPPPKMHGREKCCW